MATVSEITVKGRVQGVGYRLFVEGTARRLGIAGWVRNEPNGDVRIMARLAPGLQEAFVAALREGPPAALVRDVRVRTMPDDGSVPLTAFQIRH